MENSTRPRRRLMIIEDDHELHTVLDRLARSQCSDVDVDWASDLQTARMLLSQEHYDAVLADYVLGPQERGIEIQDSCRERQANARFAIMSSKPLLELMEAVRDPSLPLLPKPFTNRDFAAFVESLLEPAAAPVEPEYEEIE